ncbi:MAG TPA: IS66 family transposase [Chlamydiales bacterium]|nr:IS66 family transposase [Chlamydiales bacterium]
MEDESQINWKERYFELLKEVEALRAEVKALREQLNANSKNSSKPPSQDPFRLKRSSTPSGRKQGGQPGHPGHSRALVPPDQVAKIIDLLPSGCPNCSSTKFNSKLISIEYRQVIELPEIKPDVTQYNIHTCRCEKCGKRVRADVPIEAEKGFGPRLMGFLTMLGGEGHLSKRKICSITGYLGVKISLGGLSNIHRLASDLLKKPFEEIKEAVLSAENVNGDETSWSLCGKRHWMWTGASSKATFFQIDPSRSQEAFKRVFCGFENILTTDRYGAYNLYAGKKQACLAHILRDFIKMSERSGAEGAIGRILLGELKEIFGHWKKFKSPEIPRLKLQEGVKNHVQNIYDALHVGAGAEQTGNKSQALCYDLLNRFTTLWTFLEQEGVEPTNNLAERGLRPCVIARKLSNGSQSEWGIKYSERIMTVVCTLKQQTGNVFEYLTQVFFSRLKKGPAPPVFG